MNDNSYSFDLTPPGTTEKQGPLEMEMEREPENNGSSVSTTNSKRAILFFLFLLSGFILGLYLYVTLDMNQGDGYNPLLFSGIPNMENGMFAWFSTYLLNMLLGLTILFLLGMTVFGVFAIPVFLLLKGVTIGIGIMSFFSGELWTGLAECALIYAPVAALSILLFVFFAMSAADVSDNIMRNFFSGERKNHITFHVFLRSLLETLVLAVAISAVGTLLSLLYSVLFV